MSQNALNSYSDSWMELAGLSDYVSQFGNSYATSADIKMTDLYKYLMNPQSHIKQIRNASTYLTNRHGILKDVLRMVQSLPTLKYNLIWSNFDNVERNQKHEKKVEELLDTINISEFLRDGLFETAELGTVVTCLRSKQYVQFLDLDEIAIRKQRGGKWVVEFDYKTLDSIRNTQDKLDKINSMPDEVTIQSYNAYRESNDKENARYVELANCHVISIDSRRGTPWGLPITLGAWLPILQKEVINKVERSVSSRMLNQIITLSASHLDKEQTKPVPKDVLAAYFREVSKVISKKDDMRSQKSEGGSGLVALPHFLELGSVKMDNNLFKEELYTKLDNDIYQNLGVSPALIAGLDGNYASANANNEKFFSYITTILEQFEKVLNDYINLVLPKSQNCKLVLDKSTILDKQSETDKAKEFYLQTGIIEPWINAQFSDSSLSNMINQAKYEKETLQTDVWFKPPLNAYTSSGKDTQNSSGSSPSNENTEKERDNNNNGTPRAGN